jgi:hypothetical protein
MFLLLRGVVHDAIQMSSASIKIEVSYDVPAGLNPAPPAPPAVVEDNIADSSSSLSGSGDAAGASSTATEPNNAGGTDKREKTNPVPPGCTFTSARVIVTVTCANGSKVTLDRTGNVSASGAIDGECVTTSVVNKTFDGRTTTLTTSTARECCPGASVARDPQAQIRIP